MKIKRSDLNKINNTIDETLNFLIGFLDFANEDQIEYVNNLIDGLSYAKDKLSIERKNDGEF